MTTLRRLRALTFAVAMMAPALHAGEQPKTLRDFGVAMKHGQPVYPLPANVALGLYDPDPLLDLACFIDSKIQVWRNLGNGTFGNAPVYEQRVRTDVVKMGWKKSRRWAETIYDTESWGDLYLTHANGSTEKVSHEWMSNARASFASLPQAVNSFAPLNFVEKWRSEPNIGLGTRCVVGDLDNDGRDEVVYMFSPAAGDTLYRIVVYTCVGNDSFVVRWDTTTSTIIGVLGISDVDRDGHKEIITSFRPRTIPFYPRIGLLECLGPGQFRLYDTNIGFERPLMKVTEADVNHNGVKELVVLTSSSSVSYDNTFIYIAEFTGKGISPPSPAGWMMGFNQELARCDFYVTNIAVGQVDGIGRDEIVLGIGGSLGITEPIPILYLWYNGVPGPFAWEVRKIRTGLWSDAGAPMFVNLDADTVMEFIAGGAGPPGHGSMFAIKHLHDTTWSVMWADSSLRNGPLWVNSGLLQSEFVVAGANVWAPSFDTTFSQFSVYYPNGVRRGLWTLDRAMIQQFHLLDIDDDGRTNLIMARLGSAGTGSGRFLSDFEIDSTTSVGTEGELPAKLALLQNYPNPFNPTTTIVYALSSTAHVRLSVFNLLGQQVAVLVDEKKDGGIHKIVWDATALPSGGYFYRLHAHSLDREEVGNFTATKKMILLR